jgi:hypothetical protein
MKAYNMKTMGKYPLTRVPSYAPAKPDWQSTAAVTVEARSSVLPQMCASWGSCCKTMLFLNNLGRVRAPSDKGRRRRKTDSKELGTSIFMTILSN